MKHYGDITKISGADVPLVDIVTGGSPCQDLSTAGKRAGLAGERSGLFMEQIRVIREMRERSQADGRADEFVQPRYMVWENVAGVFSNGGEDFRTVLEETARIKDENAVIPRPTQGKWTPSGLIVGNGYSIAWRTHNAMWWGVPQRRRRVCLLADFDGYSAGRILFELRRKAADGSEDHAGGHTGRGYGSEVCSQRESLPRDFEKGREQREGITGDIEKRPFVSSR